LERAAAKKKRFGVQPIGDLPSTLPKSAPSKASAASPSASIRPHQAHTREQMASACPAQAGVERVNRTIGGAQPTR